MNEENRMNILNYSEPHRLTRKPMEENEEHKRILKKLPEGFGPDHPRWKIPSLRQKWLKTQGVRFAQPKPITPNPVDDNPYRPKRRGA